MYIYRFVQLLKCLVLCDSARESKPTNAKTVGFSTGSKRSVAAGTKPHPSGYSLSKPDQRLSESHPDYDSVVELVAGVCQACFDGNSQGTCSLQ